MHCLEIIRSIYEDPTANPYLNYKQTLKQILTDSYSNTRCNSRAEIAVDSCVQEAVGGGRSSTLGYRRRALTTSSVLDIEFETAYLMS